MVNNNFPVVVRHAIKSGFHKVQTYSKNTWVRLSFLGGLLIVLSQKDFSFHISMGENKVNSANIIGPSNIKATPASLHEISKSHSNEKPKNTNIAPASAKHWWVEIRDRSPDIVNRLNLANAATAVGDALSEEEKLKAAQYSNLGFALNPGYAEKHKIPAAIVEAKYKTCINYINRYSKTAQEEAELFNIPASITLAQGLLESNAGDSKLAKNDNNHFGIKCKAKCLGCRCANYTDDSQYDMFRIFESPWESFREHSKLLTGDRYKHLTQLERKDYKNWAHGLKAAGYATDKTYGEKLIKIIEAFDLDKFDKK